MEKEKYLIIADSDLDGTVSCWLYNHMLTLQHHKRDIQIDILHTTVKKFRTDLTVWCNTHGALSEYNIVQVLDIDTHNDYEFIDYENVYIIDHHKSHVDNLHVYKNAHLNVEVYPSCAKLLYNTIKDNCRLTNDQKKLIFFANDYDSYELKSPQSLMMNIVYWSYTGNRYEKFVSDFGNGFTEFKQNHKNMITIWKNNFKQMIENLVIFSSTINIDNKPYSCCSVFGEFAINELAAYLFKKQKCDVVMIVNKTTQRVYVRRSKTCEADMSKFVLSLSDKEAGGHEAAAGCLLNNNIIELTKQFTRIH